MFFEVAGRAGRPQQAAAALPPAAATVFIIFSVLLLGYLAATAVVAWHNIEMGRSDRRGAAGLAALVLVSIMLGWVVAGNHVAAATELGSLLWRSRARHPGPAFAWLFYMAIEPYVRRNWPEALISWNRLHSRKLRDPLVASHVLAGLAAWSSSGLS